MDKAAKTSGGSSAREAILAAFRDIILEGGYEQCRVLDVVARSAVARSTFYEHFQSREDLLRDSLRVPFEVFARLAAPSCDIARVAYTLDHIARNRALMRSLMANPGLETLISVMSEVLETDAAVAPHISRAVAGAYLAVLSEWLIGNDARTAHELARFLRDLTARILATAKS
jgi:AcrR family transcriptional regulator